MVNSEPSGAVYARDILSYDPISFTGVDCSADNLINSVQRTKIRNTLLVELNIRDVNADKGMNGSGMIIVNPPWKLESEAKEFLPVLKDLLQEDNKSSFQLRWITPE